MIAAWWRPALAAFVITGAVFVGLWAYLGRPVPLPDVPGGRLGCLSYSPYEGDQSPLVKDYRVSSARIDADLKALSAVTGCLRTYSSLGPQGEVARLAGRYGIEVMQGVWIRGDDEDDAREIAAGLDIARRHRATVRALVLGNEVLLRREMSGARLAALIAGVRAESPVPIAYADIYEFWRRSPEVARAVDLAMVHVLPYWDDPTPVAIDAVQDHVRAIVERAQRTFPTTPLMIGEIGWPSAGRTRGAAVPSRVNAARFVREFAATTAPALGVDYNIIEGIDQTWKRAPEGTVGGYWGLFDAERRLKFPLAGPVSEWPGWWLGPLAGTAGAAAVMGWAARRRRLSAGQWLALGFIGQILGTLLFLQARFAAETAMTWAGWTVAAVASVLTLFAAGVLAALTAGWAERASLPVPATIADVMGWLRHPMRHRPDRRLLLGLLYAATGMAAAYLCLTFVFDARHRDIPLAQFALPAVAMAVVWWTAASRAAAETDRREEAWLALVLVAGGLVALDGIGNLAAVAWAALALLIAVPWLGAARHELRRLLGVAIAAGRPQ